MFLSKYNTARHIYTPIVKRGVVDFAVGADWTPAAGDVKISKDGGAAANVTNLPTAIAMGNTAYWDFSLTATEMQAALVVVTVADAATKAVEDQAFEIETYGNASAQHALDLGTATVNPGTGGIVAASFAAGAIDATAIATDAIGSAELATTAVNEIRDAIVAYLSGRQGTATAGAASSITLDAGASTTVDFYVGQDVLIIGGTGVGQARLITAYSAGRVATVGEAWATNPDNTSVFVLLPNRAMVSKMLTDTMDANALKTDAVTEMQTGLATSAALATVQADTDDIQTRLPAALVGGRMDSSVGAMAANVMTAAAAADDLTTELQTGVITRRATAQAGAASTITLDSGASAVDDFYKGQMIVITSGTGGAQVRLIHSYVGSTKVATVGDSWATNPDATSVFAIHPARVYTTLLKTDSVNAAALASDAVTEIQTGLATSSALATVQADTDDIQTRLPAALVSGRMDSSVGAMAANVLTAAAIAADAIGASELATDAVAEIVAAVWAQVATEPSACPTFSSSILQHLAYFALLALGELDVTDAQVAVRNIADNANVATYATTDDGTTLTAGPAT